MKNILILGANGGLAQTVIPVLLENPELILTLVSRNIRRLQTFANERVNVVQADVMDLPQLESRGKMWCIPTLRETLKQWRKILCKQ